MPNWCQNNVTFKHEDQEQINKIVEAIENKKLFDAFIPVPQELRNTVSGYLGDTDDQLALLEKQRQNIEKYGYATWYDFCVANWGTKWDVSDVYTTEEQPNEIKISFDTAWSPPLEFYRTMDELGFDIQAYYYEGGCGFCGEYTSECGTAEYTWDDLESAKENIPDYIDEEFAITENMEMWEEDDEE
jgi:hypothetical protein